MIKTLTLLVSVLSFSAFAASDATVPAPVDETTVEAPADADAAGN